MLWNLKYQETKTEKAYIEIQISRTQKTIFQKCPFSAKRLTIWIIDQEQSLTRYLKRRITDFGCRQKFYLVIADAKMDACKFDVESTLTNFVGWSRNLTQDLKGFSVVTLYIFKSKFFIRIDFYKNWFFKLWKLKLRDMTVYCLSIQ